MNKESHMLNVVIPMAGLGSRFVNAGYKNPKPFIVFNGKPMICHVMENLPLKGARYLLIAQQEHLKQEAEIVAKIEADYPAKFIPINGLTEGAACTVLHAVEEINNDLPLLTANSDQLVDVDLQLMVDDAQRRNLSGSILTFSEPGRDPKWSYVRLDQNDLVVETAEKVPLSDYATVGIYYFASGQDFVNAATRMLVEQNRSNKEYYVCPVYNYLIRSGKRVGYYNIDQSVMHGLGTPEDLEAYLKEHECSA